MAVAVQKRRGSRANNDAFTGAVGEVVMDTDSKNLRVHDGVKLGGYEQGMPIAKGIADLRTIQPSNDGRFYLAFHTTTGDGSGGLMRAVTGAAAGTYIDDNKDVIVPTGGNGSSAWLREFNSIARTQMPQGLQRVSTNLPADYQLQTWSDALEDGHYDVSLTVPQNGLPVGWWYIDVQRHSYDLNGSRWRTLTATSFGPQHTPNDVYKSTCTGGIWTPFERMTKDVDFTASLTTNGYQKLPNGLIMQWGFTTAPYLITAHNVTFPIAFPNVVLNAQMTKGTPAGVSNNTGETYIGSISLTGMGVQSYQQLTGDVTTQGVMWMATGY